jgi:outer membrane protein
MKNPVKAMAFALLFIFSLPVFVKAQSKAASASVAHFDLDSLLEVMPDFKRASEEAAAYYKMLENQMLKMQEQLEQKVNEYDSLKGKLSAFMLSVKQQEIVALQQNIQTFETSAQADFTNKRAALLKPIYEKINNAAKAIAIRRGYKYVIDSSKASAIVIYASPGDDIFTDMLKELGILLPAPATPDQAAPKK